MSQKPMVGTNQTSRHKNPEQFEVMATGSQQRGASSEGDARELLSQVRASYAKSSSPVGHVPFSGDADADPASVALTDKLGERLAFERTGTRLYDGLLSKHEAYGSFEGGPSRADLEHIREEELEHFLMLHQIIEELGEDPAAVSPSANLQATVSRGVQDAITDPRVNLLQSLEAILVAELADGASWEMLCDLASRAGQERFLPAFERALASEQEHVEKVKAWIQAGHDLV